MDTKLKGFWEKVKEFFKNMSTKVRILLGAVLVLIIAAVIALVLWSNNRPYTTLFTNLSTTEANEVISYLQENSMTDYRLEGDTILVRADQQELLLGQLALAGYPKSGSLYETYFNNTGTMSTTTQDARAFQIAVQEKLESIIRTFPGVQDAQVVIAPGEDRTYVLEDISTVSTAVAKVTMRDGVMLTNQQADGIRRLVAHAVAGLEIENVEVLDGIGNTYSDNDAAAANDAAALKQQQEEYYNNRIRTAVMQILSPIYGTDNVKVAVNTYVDINRRFIESTTYHQPEGSYENGGLIGSENWLYYVTRDGLTPAGGVVGAESNANLPTYVEDLEGAIGDEDTAGQSGTRENKIDETHEQVEIVVGTITDITISVTINENANTAASLSIDALRGHVANASGIGGEEEELNRRISILVAPFPAEQMDPFVDGGIFSSDMIPLMIIGGTALLLLVILLIIILVIRGKRRKQRQAEQEALEEQLAAENAALVAAGVVPPELAGEAGIAAAGPGEDGANIMNINNEKILELRKSIRQFVQNNPEVAAQMLKVWLKGGEDDNG